MFINVGLQKLNTLIQRDDFVKISSVVEFDNVLVIKLEFTSQSCTINHFGRVSWFDKGGVFKC
jgi:hypothetical protein